VVPFRGVPAQLVELQATLAALELRDGDSLVIVDNTPGASPLAAGTRAAPVLAAAGIAAPGYARNRGAQQGEADWLVFIDADTVPPPDLLDRYFDPPPAQTTALLAGGVRDEAVSREASPAARYAHIRGIMGQDNTFRFGEWSFAQTANAACRRAAFEAVGGFREDVRAGEDADLTFRLRAAGWEVERREGAAVVHRSRQSVRGFVRQKLGHGAGAAWLAHEWPGAFPARRLPGLAWWGARRAARGLVAAAVRRDRDRMLWAIFEPLEHLSYEVGRSLSNEPRDTR